MIIIFLNFCKTNRIVQQTKLLDIKNLGIVFFSEEGKNKIVNNINFSLHKTETIGIVGESGSGKSMTALMIMKLLPSSVRNLSFGEIIFYDNPSGVNLVNLSEKEMQKLRGKKISMIFQEPMTSLNPTQKIGQQISEIIQKHTNYSNKKIKKKVLNLLEEVQLPSIERIYNSYPFQLSGGQRQRVMIAIAISCNPDLLIADEPTTALDITTQKEILSLLKEIQLKYDIGIIFISHDLSVVKQIADNIIVLKDGEIIEKGKTDIIFSNPKQKYTRSLLETKKALFGRRLKQLPIIEKEKKYDYEEVAKIQTNEVKEIYISDEDRNLKHQKIYSQKPLFRFENVHVSFPIKNKFFGKEKQKDYLKKINFNIYPQETLGLIGESGSGKTTIGKALLHLINLRKGSIYYKDQNISNISEKQFKKFRQNFQIVFQDPYSSLNPKQTAGESLTEILRFHKIGNKTSGRIENAKKLLEKVELHSDSFYKYPHQFSGGERQRIAIAKAISTKPEFIILDEATSALDVSIQASILNLLNKLKIEFDISYLFISHDLSVVRYMSDRIIVLKNGVIVETNDADKIFKKPEENYTKLLIDAIPS